MAAQNNGSTRSILSESYCYILNFFFFAFLSFFIGALNFIAFRKTSLINRCGHF